MNNRAYLSELMSIIGSISLERRQEFMQSFLERQKNPVAAFGWNAFLGYLGADRFYLGQMLFGFLKLITAGGLGIWVIVDYFQVAGITRTKNIEAARQIKASMA